MHRNYFRFRVYEAGLHARFALDSMEQAYQELELEEWIREELEHSYTEMREEVEGELQGVRTHGLAALERGSPQHLEEAEQLYQDAFEKLELFIGKLYLLDIAGGELADAAYDLAAVIPDDRPRPETDMDLFGIRSQYRQADRLYRNALGYVENRLDGRRV